MSGNLDLVRSICAAWERGDFTWSEWAHPDIDWVFAGGPAPAEGMGFAELSQRWQEWLDAWEEISVEAEGFRELEPDRILVAWTMSARGKTSGLRLQTRTASLFYVQDGKVTRLVHYIDPERALADLGLTPQGDAVDRRD